MNLKIFEDIPPWEWPEDAARIFLGVLGDDEDIAEAASEAMVMTEAFFSDEDDESPH